MLHQNIKQLWELLCFIQVQTAAAAANLEMFMLPDISSLNTKGI